MATKKPMKKFKRYDEGGSVDEATAKQRGLDMSNKEKPVGFFERIRMGNIDEPGTEAYNRFGAGRGRAAEAESKPQIVPRIPPQSRVPSPNEQSGNLQNLISAGADIEGRSQNEGYRPNAGTASERATLEGAFDSGKITENTGPRTKPIVKTPVKPAASKPKEADKPSQYAGALRGMRSDAGTSPPVGSNSRREEGKSAADKMDTKGMNEKAKAALADDPTALIGGGAAATAAALLAKTKLGKFAKLFKGAKDTGAKRLERPGTVAGKDFLARDYEGPAKAGAKGVPKKQLGYSKDTDVSDVVPKKTSYRSETNPTKREDARADEARDKLKDFLTRDLDRGMKRGGAVKKYASGGMVSSASKRADGIASKGKTRCKIC
jgi:hypothetical protein